MRLCAGANIRNKTQRRATQVDIAAGAGTRIQRNPHLWNYSGKKMNGEGQALAKGNCCVNQSQKMMLAITPTTDIYHIDPPYIHIKHQSK